mgnify:CR=1 FL=1
MAEITRGGHKFAGYSKPIKTPGHSSGKSHAVVVKDGEAVRLIRFGQQGASTAGKPKAGAKGKMSAAYWANKVKW